MSLIAGTFNSCGFVTYFGEPIIDSALNVPDAIEITDINPKIAFTTGGETITLTGINFTDDMKIEIGDFECKSVKVINETTATCSLPEAKLGFASIRAYNDWHTDSRSNEFSIHHKVNLLRYSTKQSLYSWRQ